MRQAPSSDALSRPDTTVKTHTIARKNNSAKGVQLRMTVTSVCIKATLHPIREVAACLRSARLIGFWSGQQLAMRMASSHSHLTH